jgi:fumarylacetoacetase
MMSISDNSDFSIHNIPFGVGERLSRTFICTRIEGDIIDLTAWHSVHPFDGVSHQLSQHLLNDFIALGKTITSSVRSKIQSAYASSDIPDNCRYPVDEVMMVLPIAIGDYTDFYSSREHAYNVGVMFRDPANALLPNWLHIPIGYHGRASSIVVSGTDIKRPHGQTKADDAASPTYGPSKQLDFELEMAFVIGKDSAIGQTVSTKEAEDYIFGMMLFNDWSARDIQKWEYVPLGPFLGKNFGSTLSPWLVTMEALAPFRVDGPIQDPKVLPYLQYEGAHNYDIHLSVDIVTSQGDIQRVSTSNYKYMYWNMVQQLAHHTSNGCNIRVGDLMASGTISGPSPDSYGSMLEIAWKGTKPVAMPDGTERRFIHDGDEVRMRGWAEKDGIRIGFGACDGKVK